MQDWHVNTNDAWEGFDVLDFARFWQAREPRACQDAQDEFIRQVDPYVIHAGMPHTHEVEMTNIVFSDWLVFDYVDSEGLTPLERYINEVAKWRGTAWVGGLSQMVRTQRFSEFWVTHQDVERGTSTIIDAFTGETYILKDVVVARRACWSEGLLGLRIAEVDGEWYDVGAVPLHDNYPHQDTFGNNIAALLELHPEGATLCEEGKGISFAAFARQLLGADGGFLPSARLECVA